MFFPNGRPAKMRRDLNSSHHGRMVRFSFRLARKRNRNRSARKIIRLSHRPRRRQRLRNAFLKMPRNDEMADLVIVAATEVSAINTLNFARLIDVVGIWQPRGRQPEKSEIVSDCFMQFRASADRPVLECMDRITALLH